MRADRPAVNARYPTSNFLPAYADSFACAAAPPDPKAAARLSSQRPAPDAMARLRHNFLSAPADKRLRIIGSGAVTPIFAPHPVEGVKMIGRFYKGARETNGKCFAALFPVPRGRARTA